MARYFMFVRSDVDDFAFSPYEFRLLGAIARRAGADSICYESIENMAARCRMSRRKALDVLSDLEFMNVIEVTRMHGTTNCIIIISPDRWHMVPFARGRRVKSGA